MKVLADLKPLILFMVFFCAWYRGKFRGWTNSCHSKVPWVDEFMP